MAFTQENMPVLSIPDAQLIPLLWLWAVVLRIGHTASTVRRDGSA